MKCLLYLYCFKPDHVVNCALFGEPLCAQMNVLYSTEKKTLINSTSNSTDMAVERVTNMALEEEQLLWQ